MTASRRAVTWLSLLVIIDLAWGAAYIHRTSFVHGGQRVFSLWDDAMISMQYARNLRLGHGLVWNAGGDRVQGFTNLGVTLVMAGAHWLPLARDFRQSYVKVETRFGVNFFMRSEALGKLTDEEVILVDLISGEKSRRGDTRGR